MWCTIGIVVSFILGYFAAAICAAASLADNKMEEKIRERNNEIHRG